MLLTFFAFDIMLLSQVGCAAQQEPLCWHDRFGNAVVR